MRIRLATSVVLATVSAAAAGERMAEPRPVAPSLTRAGPYGSPLAFAPELRAAATPLLSDYAPGLPDPTGVGLGESGPLGRDPRGSRPLTPATSTVARLPGEVAGGGEAGEGPPIPGMLGRSPTQIPGVGRVLPGQEGPPLKSGVVAPHVKPDFAVPVGKDTSVGLFSEVGRLELEGRNGPVPSVKARDVGAGLTLQYRFGQ